MAIEKLKCSIFTTRPRLLTNAKGMMRNTSMYKYWASPRLDSNCREVGGA